MSLREIPWRAPSLALIAMNLVLGVLLLVLVARGTQTRSLLKTPARARSVNPVALTRPAVSANFAAIQDRALMYTTRRFYVAPVGASAPSRPQYRLVGTFIIPSKPAVALLTGVNGGSRKVKPGDTLDGWLVEAVEGHRVALRYENETFDITGSASGGSGLTVHTVPLAHGGGTPAVIGIGTLGASAATSGQVLPAASAGAPIRLTQDTSPHKSTSAPRLYIPPPPR